jgi:hypothetical protein
MRRDGYDSFTSRRPSAKGDGETGGSAEAIGHRHPAGGEAASLRLCGAAYGWNMLVRKIVDVFVGDTLKGSYPVIIECQGRPAEDEFVDQVRNGMDRGFYSADDIKVAKFVIREAGAAVSGSDLGARRCAARRLSNVLGGRTEEDTWRE